MKRPWLIICWIAFAIDRKIATIADDMRVRHDAIAVDDKPRTDAALNRARVPRRAVIRFHVRGADADQTLLDLPVRLRLQDLAREHKREDQEDKTMHGGQSREDETEAR